MLYCYAIVSRWARVTDHVPYAVVLKFMAVQTRYVATGIAVDQVEMAFGSGDFCGWSDNGFKSLAVDRSLKCMAVNSGVDP